MFVHLSIIKDYLSGINFHTHDYRRKISYMFQLFNHLFAITYIVFIAISLFAIVASFIIFIIGLDLRVLINDSQLIRILAIYVSCVIFISAIISLRNTLLKMKQIKLKDFSHKHMWFIFLLVHISYALLVLIIGLNL